MAKKITIKLTYEIDGKTTSIEKTVEPEDLTQVHEFMVRWFKYEANNELEMTPPDRDIKRDKFEKEILDARKAKYNKLKFLEKT